MKQHQKTIQIPKSYLPLINDNDNNLIFVVGGAGAGKTWNIVIKLVLKALQYKRKICIIRKTFGSVKDTILPIFQEILSKLQIPYVLNKSDLILEIENSKFCFRGLVYKDNNEKEVNRLKGITDITDIWVDEATELTDTEFLQLGLRLRGRHIYPPRQFILSFNPISQYHWIYKNYYEKNVGKWYKYTYQDNPFLDPQYVQQLENLQATNPNYYRVYALGEWGAVEGLVFQNYSVEVREPKGTVVYGVDFGFTAPTVVLECWVHDQEIYVARELYVKGLTNTQLIETIKNWNYVKTAPFYCDSAEPDRIQELQRAGINAIGIKKQPVKQSLGFLLSKKITISPNCINTLKEISIYSYMKKGDQWIDEPAPNQQDHCIDALRYAVMGGEAHKINIKEVLRWNWFLG